MKNYRLLLRVLLKLMLLFSMLFVFYILFSGFLQPGDENTTVEVDVSSIAVGDAAYFQLGGRSVIVVNKPIDGSLAAADGYLVAYAQDTFYGCEVRLDAQAQNLKAQCADVVYGLDGKLLKGTKNHDDLHMPDYQWLDQQRLSIVIE